MHIYNHKKIKKHFMTTPNLSMPPVFIEPPIIEPPIGLIPNAPITTACSVVRCKKGNKVKVQIKVADFKEITAISLNIQYKTNALEFVTIKPARTMPSPEGLFFKANKIDSDNMQLKIAWSSLTPFSLKNTNDLFLVYFTFLGKPTKLIWQTKNCEYASTIDNMPTPLCQEPPENFYINGKVTPD